jgi:predicted enzyme related to lactoylglutathione lyase
MAVDRRSHRRALCLWEARAHIGASLVNTPGAMTWNDLVTPDPEAAAAFFGSLLGWTTEEIPGAGGYRVIRNGERTNGGMMRLDAERMGAGTPPHWMPYFGHEDVDAPSTRCPPAAVACTADRTGCRRARSRSSRIRRARCSPCGRGNTTTSGDPWAKPL